MRSQMEVTSSLCQWWPFQFTIGTHFLSSLFSICVYNLPEETTGFPPKKSSIIIVYGKAILLSDSSAKWHALAVLKRKSVQPIIMHKSLFKLTLPCNYHFELYFQTECVFLCIFRSLHFPSLFFFHFINSAIKSRKQQIKNEELWIN